MKKPILTTLLATLFLSGCATTGEGNAISNVGMNIFKSAVDRQCRSELNSYNAYQVLTSFMGAEQKTNLEDKVCGCVSEKAPQSISMSEVGRAIINQEERPKIVGTAVAKTLKACANDFLTGRTAN